jgi:hypothetical protein
MLGQQTPRLRYHGSAKVTLAIVFSRFDRAQSSLKGEREREREREREIER